MIAGPNGSGKTSLTNYLRAIPELDFGTYINADELQASLVNSAKISFNGYDVKVLQEDFNDYYNAHPLFRQCEGTTFTIKNNVLRLSGAVPAMGYFAALLADFIRHRMIKGGITFSFETVMSDPDKIQLLHKARNAGYRTYLYFVCTADVAINIKRVADRVRKSGHNVPVDKITGRYKRSLDLLWPAIELADRSYLFDNSGMQPELVLEITPDKKAILNLAFVPGWVKQHVLSKL